MSRRIKVVARGIGALLAATSVIWIVKRFIETGALSQLNHSPHFDRLVGWVVVAIPVYAAGLCCAGLAWWCIQASFLEARPALMPLFRVYATTQFAKYLPGNVGHYLSRHLVLRKLGMSHRALLLGTLGEAGFLVLGALVWAAGAAGTLLPRLGFAPEPWQVLLAEGVCLGIGYSCLQWWRGRSAVVQAWIPLHRPAWLLLPLPLELLLFGAMSLALITPAHVLLQDSGDLWLLPAAAGASWVAGFLVVGAPAGLGVREAIFLALLRGHMPESDILLLAAAFRVVTFGGDVLLLLLGLALRRYVSPSE